MPSVGLLCALPLIAGAASAVASSIDASPPVWVALCLYGAVLVTWRYRRGRLCTVAVIGTFLAAGCALGAHARAGALAPSLRVALDREVGDMSIDAIGPAGAHDPIRLRARLIEDAAVFEDFASLRVHALALDLNGAWRPVAGRVALSVSGSALSGSVAEWRAGRTIEAPVAFRRPVRYLNAGVADFERDLALGGTALFGSVKSGLLVTLVQRGTRAEEWAAGVRSGVRNAVDRWVSSHDRLSGAIVTAVLIGDRTGLPDQVRERLQAAGTYHIIAISGGNIAILAGLGLGILMIAGIRGRTAALLAIVGLIAYAEVVTTGPSVWRATLMAVIYLLARAIDVRTPPWQATAVAAAIMVVVRPLDVRDVGFILTFGATAALLEGARRGARLLTGRPVLSWVVASIVASASVEMALLPVSAQSFSRVTVAGFALNLIAVPLMGVVQVAGLIVCAVPSIDGVAWIAGWTAHAGATAIVRSANLLDLAPWLSIRVPPPGALLLTTYYAALFVLVFGHRRRARQVGGAVLAVSLIAITAGIRPWSLTFDAGSEPAILRLTMFDVGQAESILLETPGGPSVLVDTGGTPFGSSFDVGGRVLAPALWARGFRSLDEMVVTHGDPDHLGGALTLLELFRPARLWEGVAVPRHAPTAAVRAAAGERGIHTDVLRAGHEVIWGKARVRVLHPPEPDWERTRVRNDDSIVLEVVYGEVAFLLTGDISAEIEREILPQLSPATTRVLKIAHHGSRTSSSTALLETWRPQLALISAGRGNSFGHPTADVLRRLASIGATVLRTDLHGQITVETDGAALRSTTFTGDAR
jgi:competence protein ComEC